MVVVTQLSIVQDNKLPGQMSQEYSSKDDQKHNLTTFLQKIYDFQNDSPQRYL